MREDGHAPKLLTVMYLTSISVFLSSSDIMSLWNLLNCRWGGGARERRGEEDTPVIINLMGRMKCSSLSASLSAGTQGERGRSQREKRRAAVWSGSVRARRACRGGWWGFRAQSEVVLLNESETKGWEWCLQTPLPVLPDARPLEGVKVLPSPRPWCGGAHAGRTTELENTISERTRKPPPPETLSHTTQTTRIQACEKVFVPSVFFIFSDLNWCCDSPAGVH